MSTKHGMFLHKGKPTNIKEALWWEEMCVRRQGGYDLDTSNLPAGFRWLAKGTILAFNKTNGKAIVGKTATAFANANATVFAFESYNPADHREKWGEGKVVVIGIANGKTTVKVTENTPADADAENFVGKIFVVEAVQPVAGTYYSLKTTDGEEAGIDVKISLADGATNAIKVFKGHILVVGDKIGGSAITAIDTTNEAYDVITLGAIVSDVKADEVINDDYAVGTLLGLAYETSDLQDVDYPQVTPTLQAFEIEEDTMPYPVNDAVKAALGQLHQFKIQ